MYAVLGFLLADVVCLAFVTHATPYVDEHPLVLSQVIRVVFNNGVIANFFYGLFQVVWAAILFTSANTSFTGFSAMVI